MKKPLLTCALLLFLGYLACAQTNFNPTVVPPSPTASSLGKYGNFPVSHYTGTTNVSIPIYSYSLPGSDFSLGVNLDYHTGGIRVDEMAPSVGLGWALRAGGMVSRTMVGLSIIPATG